MVINLGEEYSYIDIKAKLKISYKILHYFFRLYLGAVTGRIYFEKKESNQIKEFPFDEKDLQNKIDTDIRETLEKMNLPNVVDVDKNIGFEHIGYGCFATRIFGRIIIMTQTGSSFFFSTSKKQFYELSVIFQSFTKLTVEIKVENTVLKEIKLPSLCRKKVTLQIDREIISEGITKIVISTDKLWSTKFLEQQKDNVPVGVGIIKMKIRELDSSLGN